MVKAELFKVKEAFYKVKVHYNKVHIITVQTEYRLFWHGIGKLDHVTNPLTMKKNVILLFTPVLLLIILLLFGYNLTNTTYKSSADKAIIVNVSEKKAATSTKEDKWVSMNKTTKSAGVYTTAEPQAIIEYALSLIGSPYQYSGITPAGFDCSGFVTHVFDTYNMAIPHSSAMQANEGVAVPKTNAAPGDLVIFTGTDKNDRTPGHVGIVISEPGDTISFVHSSSNGGVKISKVQGTRYDVRFLEIRRVL